MKIENDLRSLTTTQKNIAKALGLTQPRIFQLIKSGIMIRDESDPNGGIKIFESLKNFYQSRTETSSEDVDFQKEHALLEKAKREKAEIQLAKLKGELYEATIVEQVISTDLLKVRNALLSLPRKLSVELEGKSKAEIDSILTREIEEALTNLSKYDPALFESNDLEDEDSG